jgi:hypothetical protein
LQPHERIIASAIYYYDTDPAIIDGGLGLRRVRNGEIDFPSVMDYNHEVCTFLCATCYFDHDISQDFNVKIHKRGLKDSHDDLDSDDEEDEEDEDEEDEDDEDEDYPSDVEPFVSTPSGMEIFRWLKWLVTDDQSARSPACLEYNGVEPHHILWNRAYHFTAIE